MRRNDEPWEPDSTSCGRRTFLGSTLAVAGVGFGWAQTATTSQSTGDRIDTYLTREMDAERLPGVSIGLVEGEGTTYLRGFGSAGGAPVSPDTPFLIGSVSKSFTGLAIAQLVERDVLALEDTVEAYLPWLQLSNTDAASRITVAHLLGHRSGIPEGAYRVDHGSIEAGLRALRNVELAFPPGEGFEYSSVNYQILGAIVQKVTGLSFGEYLQEHVFSPLEMSQSFTSQRAAERNGLATGHQYVLGYPITRQLPHDPGGLPNGYVVSSTRDLTRYVRAHLNQGIVDGKRVVSPTVIERTHTALASVDSSNEYAMGWILGERNGMQAVWHSGKNPNFQAAIVMIPEQNLGVVVLINSASPLVGNVARRLATGVASIVVGRIPPEGNRTLPETYVPIIAGIAIVSLLEIRSMWKLRTYSDRLAEQTPRWRRLLADGRKSGLQSFQLQYRRWFQFLRQGSGPIVWDVIIGSVLLFVIPTVFAPSLEAMWLGAPDITIVLVAFGILSLGKGAFKCWVGVRSLRRARAIGEP